MLHRGGEGKGRREVRDNGQGPLGSEREREGGTGRWWARPREGVGRGCWAGFGSAKLAVGLKGK